MAVGAGGGGGGGGRQHQTESNGSVCGGGGGGGYNFSKTQNAAEGSNTRDAPVRLALVALVRRRAQMVATRHLAGREPMQPTPTEAVVVAPMLTALTTTVSKVVAAVAAEVGMARLSRLAAVLLRRATQAEKETHLPLVAVAVITVLALTLFTAAVTHTDMVARAAAELNTSPFGVYGAGGGGATGGSGNVGAGGNGGGGSGGRCVGGTGLAKAGTKQGGGGGGGGASSSGTVAEAGKAGAHGIVKFSHAV